MLHKGSRKRQTMVLDVAYDAKVLKMHLSHDEKLLALLLFTQ